MEKQKQCLLLQYLSQFNVLYKNHYVCVEAIIFSNFFIPRLVMVPF